MTLKTFTAATLLLLATVTVLAVEPQEFILTKGSADRVDLSHESILSNGHIPTLTDEDYRQVAEEIKVEPAAIKAIVEIEAGKAHEGFHAPGMPIINFDLSMFRKFARKNGVNLSRYSAKHPVVFRGPDARRYGSTQAAQHERLRQAMLIDEKTAIQGTFWGMFQIGGFNWKLCGCKDMTEFVEKMSRSERDQLDLFAKFIVNTGLDKYLRSKNWAKFASIYNGPGYARRGYHTKMAAAYARNKARMK